MRNLIFLVPGILAQNASVAIRGGENGDVGGLMGIAPSLISALGNLPKGFDYSSLMNLLTAGKETPKGFATDTGTGSGPYPASYKVDPTHPNHTIYSPIKPPSVSMPVMVWGEGGCMPLGLAYQDFLTELASYGYFIIANGPPSPDFTKNKFSAMMELVGAGLGMVFGNSSKVGQLLDSLDWVMKKKNTAKYGNVDTTRIAMAGQSCGGLEAFSASYKEPRVALTMIFNVGIIYPEKRKYLQELKVPVGLFIGGPLDIGYPYVSRCRLLYLFAD